ncbi:MAG: hypothetical protein WDO18_09990 [Acidobacteriota bacterium]
MKPATRFLPAVLALFLGSGCAALMYEIVWYQMLQLAIGSTSISMGFLLATFMGGLCIGSLWLPRYRTNLHPLKLYAYIEIGIAICGLFVLLLMPLFGKLYFAAAGYGMPQHDSPSLPRRHLPAAPDHLDGRIAPRRLSMDRFDARRCRLVGTALRW